MLGFILGKITLASLLASLASSPQPPVLRVAEPVPQPELTVVVSSGLQVNPLQGSSYRLQ